MAMMPYNLELQIDQVVLHGFAVRDRDLIQAALQQELTRLFTERGIPASFAQSVAVNQVNGASFDLAAGAKAGDIGTQIAQSIYGGLWG